MSKLISNSEAETRNFAASFAKKLHLPAFFCLYGDLGSGKTVFSKGFAEALGLDPKTIKSPTYTFVRSYKIGKNYLYHFDFYRIQDLDDVMARDLEEIFEQKNAIILVEWPERIMKLLPEKRIELFFEYKDLNTRFITVKK